MKNLFVLSLFAAGLAFGQYNTLTSTTLSAAVPQGSQTFVVASATGITASTTAPISCYVSGGGVNELDLVEAVSGTTITMQRTGTAAIPSGALLRCGSPSWFYTTKPKGSCTLSTMYVNPWIDVASGTDWSCAPTGVYVRNIDFVVFVPPTQCTFIPTTLTTTNTFVSVGGVFALNAVSNAAAGTQTLSCDFTPPTRVTTLRGAVVQDITVLLGSQVVAPTSLGTATLGTITFPVPVATTQTFSVATPVTIGGTVTTLGPTTSVATVTTAGSFLTFKHTFSTAVDLSTDLRLLQYQFPILQSAASAMTLNTAGLFVHYVGTSLD